MRPCKNRSAFSAHFMVILCHLHNKNDASKAEDCRILHSLSSIQHVPGSIADGLKFVNLERNHVTLNLCPFMVIVMLLHTTDDSLRSKVKRD